MSTEKTSGLTVVCDLCGIDDAAPALEKGGLRYTACRRCGFVYTNPRAPAGEATNEAYFVEQKQQYIEASYSTRKQKAYARVLHRFRRYRRTNRLLEIGSNVGGFIYRARAMGWDPVGVEPVEACAAYARAEHGLTSIGALLEDAGLEPDAFDVIYSNAVFEHLPSPGAVLAEAARLLRPGGVIYTKTVNWDSYTHEQMGADWQLLSPAGHVSLFTAETLPRFCRQAGLRVVKVQSAGVRLPRARSRTLAGKLTKALLSARSRLTLKGDRIVVWAERPG